MSVVFSPGPQVRPLNSVFHEKRGAHARVEKHPNNRDPNRGNAVQEEKMYKHILIPTDGTELSAKAVRDGTVLAKTLGAKVTVLTVSQPFHVFTLETAMVVDTSAEYEKHVQEKTSKILGDASSAAKAAGVACDTVHVEHEHPYQAIIDAADSRGCDLITMASHGRRGIAAVVLGSVTVKVLTHSKIPVLVHR
jgi:nucleotide-binding universal stress UspA family protein